MSYFGAPKVEQVWLDNLMQICVERYGVDEEDFSDLRDGWREDNSTNWKDSFQVAAERYYDAHRTPADAARQMEADGILPAC